MGIFREYRNKCFWRPKAQVGIFREYRNKCFWRPKCFGKAPPQIMPLRILSGKGAVQIMRFRKLGRKCHFLLRFCTLKRSETYTSTMFCVFVLLYIIMIIIMIKNPRLCALNNWRGSEFYNKIMLHCQIQDSTRNDYSAETQGLCIPTCTGLGGMYPSMHCPGGVCLGVCGRPPPPGPEADPFPRNLWKHNLRKLRLRAVKIRVALLNPSLWTLIWSWCRSITTICDTVTLCQQGMY